MASLKERAESIKSQPLTHVVESALEIGICAIITAALTGVVVKPATKTMLEEGRKCKNQWDNFWSEE